jgi:hypothetical protein
MDAVIANVAPQSNALNYHVVKQVEKTRKARIIDCRIATIVELSLHNDALVELSKLPLFCPYRT